MGWARWYLNSMLVGLLLICLTLLIYRWSVLAQRYSVAVSVPPVVSQTEAETKQHTAPIKDSKNPTSRTEPEHRDDSSSTSARDPNSGRQQQTTGVAPEQPLDLNTASASRLEQLPGIGKVLAERIVTYREEHGAFRQTSDLLNVEGIGAAKFAAIEKLVYVKSIH